MNWGHTPLEKEAGIRCFPVLQGESLTYAVKVLQGDIPAKGADVSVFIDIIGMPLTPLSFAGVARRNYRRAFYR
jgi:hypothetical protein